MNYDFPQRLNKIEKALEKAISYNFSDEWKKSSFGNLPLAVKDTYIQNLIAPDKNLIDLGGKRWRPLLLILCYEMANQKYKNSPLTLDQAYDLVPLVEFIHTASLIHDDIEDSADLRRGKPAAHITYGLDTALNAGAWFYFQAPVCIKNSSINVEAIK